MKMIKKIITEGRKKYIINERRDLDIYNKVKKLEKKKLTKEDKHLVNLIKAQLESYWRKYLLLSLSKLLKKYK